MQSHRLKHSHSSFDSEYPAYPTFSAHPVHSNSYGASSTNTHPDFSHDDFVGRDEPGQRDVYPPRAYDEYEKGTTTVTRGSIAAQMAAEGQIPKKEGLRMWRTDEHAGALMRGGRVKCCCRVCGCSFILVILILVGIIASFLLWTRPPNVTFNGIEWPTNANQVTVQLNGFLIDFNLNIGVINPNFFGANFNKIQATGFYPTAPTTALGGGSLSDVSIPKNSNTTIHFPFQVNYTTSLDPGLTIVKDIATKCGFTSGTSASQLTVDYTIRLGLKVAGIVITPSFSSSTSFDCPLTKEQIEDFLGSSVLDGITGSTSRVLKRSEEEERELAGKRARAVGIVMKRGWEETVEQGGLKRWMAAKPVQLWPVLA